MKIKLKLEVNQPADKYKTIEHVRIGQRDTWPTIPMQTTKNSIRCF